MTDESLSDRFNKSSTLAKAMITAGAILGVFVLAMVVIGLGSANSSEPPVTRSERPSSPPAKSTVQTVVVREDAGGYTNSDLTPETLKLIEQELVKRSLQRGKEHLSAQGLPAEDVTPDMIEASSWIMEAGGLRFGIVDMRAGLGRVKAIVSIQNNQFVRVSCIDTSGANITTFTGPCAAKINETFGVQLPTVER